MTVCLKANYLANYANVIVHLETSLGISTTRLESHKDDYMHAMFHWHSMRLFATKRVQFYGNVKYMVTDAYHINKIKVAHWDLLFSE